MTDGRLDRFAASAESDVSADECLALLACFIKVKDRKARAAILRLAERYAHFDQIGVAAFNHDLRPN